MTQPANGRCPKKGWGGVEGRVCVAAGGCEDQGLGLALSGAAQGPRRVSHTHSPYCGHLPAACPPPTHTRARIHPCARRLCTSGSSWQPPTGSSSLWGWWAGSRSGRSCCRRGTRPSRRRERSCSRRWSGVDGPGGWGTGEGRRPGGGGFACWSMGKGDWVLLKAYQTSGSGRAHISKCSAPSAP